MKFKNFTLLINLMTLSTTGLMTVQPIEIKMINLTKDEVNQYMNIFLANFVKYGTHRLYKEKDYYFTLDKNNKVIRASFSGDENDINSIEQAYEAFNRILNLIIKFKIWKNFLHDKTIKQYNNIKYLTTHNDIEEIGTHIRNFAILDKSNKSISYEKNMFDEMNFKEYIDKDLKATLDKVATTKPLTVNILLDAIKDLNGYALKDLTDNNGVVQMEKYLEQDDKFNKEQCKQVKEALQNEKVGIIDARVNDGCKWINDKKNNTNTNPSSKNSDKNPSSHNSSKDENPSVNGESAPSADESHKNGITKRDVLIGGVSALTGAGVIKGVEKFLTTDKKNIGAAAVNQ